MKLIVDDKGLKRKLFLCYLEQLPKIEVPDNLMPGTGKMGYCEIIWNGTVWKRIQSYDIKTFQIIFQKKMCEGILSSDAWLFCIYNQIYAINAYVCELADSHSISLLSIPVNSDVTLSNNHWWSRYRGFKFQCTGENKYFPNSHIVDMCCPKVLIPFGNMLL